MERFPDDPAALRDAYAYPGDGVWLRANMVASADGAAVHEGRAGGLGNPNDQRVLQLLRGLADVVIAGAGTVRAEGYGPVRPGPDWHEWRGDRPLAPPLAIVSGALNLDLDAPVFTEAATPTIVLTTEAAGEARIAAARKRADVVVAGGDRLDWAAALGALAERGLRRMLCEGGPRVLDQLVTAGLLDELCLTVSPMLVGGDAFRILNGPPAADPLRLRLTRLLRDEDDFLFLRYANRNE
ncbi:pyrimidine reductase family protein [Actinomadura hibisca]|uniref:pyrimidine reductase family protein n=1 Tax=Actinomadura hibisca TaxID=68565 RepID=UPI00083591E9|nr:pyrimidine reductase family protein [Actinomadura hibisca]